jgi:ABC-type transport system involved in multi-copper enzyme maturation permease subunit
MHRDNARAAVALLVDTFREAFARKIFWGLFGLSTAMILFFLFILKIDIVEGTLATISLFGAAAGRTQEIQQIVRQAYAGIATFLFTWGTFLAVFASSGLIPSVLEPGRIELLLSKPVRRWQILIGRYVGTLLVVSLNISYLVLGVWAIFGIKTGIWGKAFLFAIASAVYLFAVLLTVVVFIGVVFESAALATMVTAALMIVSPILAQTKLMDRLLSSEWSRTVWRWLYHALPKVFDIGRMTRDMVLDRQVGDWTPAWTSGIFAVVVLSVSLYIFSKRNF